MIVDPITFSVIKNGLDSIVDEMAYTVVRIARSEIVKDVMDFSAALTTADGQMVAQAKTIALHLGAIPVAIDAVLAAYGNDLAPGDVVIMNDPYHGGMHLPDIFMFMPIFARAASSPPLRRLSQNPNDPPPPRGEGPGVGWNHKAAYQGLLPPTPDPSPQGGGGKTHVPPGGGEANLERIAFAVVICHHTDVGGRVPGSNASDSTEIYQEGIRIPPLKLYRRGVIDETLEKLIKLNVRVPDRVWGDLLSQYAACQIGARGLERLIERYGADEVDAYMRELLDYTERMVRAELRRWPKGTFHFLDHIDSDGFSETPLPIKVAITVNEDSLTVDYAGSSPQVKAALNSTRSYTQSCTYLSVRSVLDRELPNNVGLFRCIEVRTPPASILDPVLPGACAARALTGYRIFDCVLGALSQIVPERVPAAGEGGNTVVCISGLRPDRRPFIIVDMLCGAWGGRPDQDGVEAITNPSQNLSNMPVEVMEAEHPVRVEAYALVPDSCGAGRYRGGIGIMRSYRVLADEALLQLRSDRVAFAPYGLAGGEPGGRSRNELIVHGEARPLAGKVTMPVARDCVISHVQAGGGGYGNPLERDPAQVREDVLDGKITPAFARERHGVHIDEDGRIDATATDAARTSARDRSKIGQVAGERR